VLRQACSPDAKPFRTVEDLAAVYCARVELEVRHDKADEARAVAAEAVREPPPAVKRRLHAGATTSVQERLHLNPRIWALYLDIEESLGSVQEVQAAFDQCLRLGVATVANVLQHA